MRKEQERKIWSISWWIWKCKKAHSYINWKNGTGFYWRDRQGREGSRQRRELGAGGPKGILYSGSHGSTAKSEWILRSSTM